MSGSSKSNNDDDDTDDDAEDDGWAADDDDFSASPLPSAEEVEAEDEDVGFLAPKLGANSMRLFCVARADLVVCAVGAEAEAAVEAAAAAPVTLSFPDAAVAADNDDEDKGLLESVDAGLAAAGFV